MPDFSEQIEQAVNEPAAASVDGRSATAVSIPDLINADKYLAGKAAFSGTNANGGPVSGWGMVGMAKARPGGAA